MDKKKSNFELLKENELQRNVYTQLLRNIEHFPYLVFSQKKLRDNPDYIDGVLNNTKKNIGRINTIDLPDDLGLKEMVIQTIKDKLKQLQIEFDSYTIKN
jgi:hypothetical protein